MEGGRGGGGGEVVVVSSFILPAVNTVKAVLKCREVVKSSFHSMS